ncbi:MAG: pilus assembly protein TadG-related protein [Desulfobulbaceae bacterium]|nr:pilus assembly protein TadG-related protein [Desulfobulbaceae bacterium]
MKIREAKNKGAVAPLVAILMVLLLGCLALVVDLGHLHNVKTELQRAVDAAALAGARELDGKNEEITRAQQAAMAVAGQNTVNGSALSLDVNADIQVGTWDVGAYGTAAADRFTAMPSGTPNPPSEMLTAVKVTKQLQIERFFAIIWGDETTTVGADAIAVVTYEEPGLPIALLSCLPYVGGSYGESVCGIKLYKELSNTDDTAGWTSLTLPTGPQGIPNAADVKFLFTKEGQKVLDTILYGDNANHQGIENSPVTPSCGTSNVGSDPANDIKCGLGPDFDPGTVSLANATAPTVAYPGSLPRWDDGDHFQRILTMNGILARGGWQGTVPTGYEAYYPVYPAETGTQYQQRLFDLYTASAGGGTYTYDNYKTDHNGGRPLPAWVTDGRFAKYISDKNDKAPKKTTDVFVHFEQPLYEAGYPLVNAGNGMMTSILGTFLDDSDTGVRDPKTGSFKSSLVGENPPFDEASAPTSHGQGETLVATLPVIYAGECGADWDALRWKVYTGLANLYITRVWKGVNDCTDAANPVTVPASPPFLCDGKSFNPIPPLTGGSSGSYTCVKLSSATDKGIEGIIMPKGKDEKIGIRKISLVE